MKGLIDKGKIRRNYHHSVLDRFDFWRRVSMCNWLREVRSWGKGNRLIDASRPLGRFKVYLVVLDLNNVWSMHSEILQFLIQVLALPLYPRLSFFIGEMGIIKLNLSYGITRRFERNVLNTNSLSVEDTQIICDHYNWFLIINCHYIY